MLKRKHSAAFSQVAAMDESHRFARACEGAQRELVSAVYYSINGKTRWPHCQIDNSSVTLQSALREQLRNKSLQLSHLTKAVSSAASALDKASATSS